MVGMESSQRKDHDQLNFSSIDVTPTLQVVHYGDLTNNSSLCAVTVDHSCKDQGTMMKKKSNENHSLVKYQEALKYDKIADIVYSPEREKIITSFPLESSAAAIATSEKIRQQQNIDCESINKNSSTDLKKRRRIDTDSSTNCSSKLVMENIDGNDSNSDIGIKRQKTIQSNDQHTRTRKRNNRKKKDSSSKLSNSAACISFEETVEVLPIPMHSEYSTCVRTRLWSNAVEIRQNAMRNRIEFAAEGWDWRKVAEDEKMHVCVLTGELIHPCHYEPMNIIF